MKNGNLPAAPTIYADMAANGQREIYCTEVGLTKREEFVRSFIQGLLSNSGGPIQTSILTGFGFCNTDISGVVNLAIEIADAALTELEKTK